jgi:pyruvate dehydrogenase (quinone)/pyruvate oxidase
MEKIAAELLVERLIEWGVNTVFGLPGDGINGVMEALRRNEDRIRFVLVHHEEAAAFMATGYAKTTGGLGVCVATSGPGGIHLLNGLYDAKLDHVPVLAITGMQETQLLGTGYPQDVQLEKLYEDVAPYDVMVRVPVQIPTLVDLAVRHALAERTVSHITIPIDLQIAPAGANPWQDVSDARSPETSPFYIPAPGMPRESDLDRAAQVLNDGHKVVILAGAGALGAGADLRQAAERLASPVVKTLSGKAAYPDDDPYCTGGLGLVGTQPSEDAMAEADTLFMVGTNFPYTKYLPRHARVVQIDISAERAGNRLPTEVPMVGDAKSSLEALVPRLAYKNNRDFLERAQTGMKGWRDKMAALAKPNLDPIRPQYLASLIDRYAADDAILTSDAGTIATWSSRYFTIRESRFFMLSGNLATMAPGLPYTIAAQIAYPDRQCIAHVGDGGFAMLMAEFLTAVRYQLPIKVFVSNNKEYGQILWEQMVLGFPEFGARHRRPFANFAAWAEACGGMGIRVQKAADLEAAVQETLAYAGPALLDCMTNPDEPVMPAKVSYREARRFAEAYKHGHARRATAAATPFRDKIEDLKP